MAFDVYQLCPCGSGKKLKFCCADIAEDMEKVSRLNENGQHRAAMKILDKLAATHPETVWNETARASLLLTEGQPGEAAAILEALHAQHPENQAVIGLLATAAFTDRGYTAAREAIWRAFRKATNYPEILGPLALGIAGEMFGRRRYLAARQHLTLAMRMMPNQEKQAVFVRLLEFDGSAEIPYPLRSVHSLREIDGDADRQEAARKAIRLAERGCFGTAAERFVQLAQQTPDDPAIEYNIALCTAWEGDEEVAAEAFGRAALAEPDFELAAEYAALEQFLRANFDDRAVRMRNVEFRVAAASKLITDLAAHSRCIRFELPPEAAATEGMPDAVFELSDRPLPESLEGIDVDAIPLAVGQVAVFGSPEDADEPRVALAAFEGDRLDAAIALLREIAPDLEQVDDLPEDVEQALASDVAFAPPRASFPERTPQGLRLKIERRRWELAVERWLATPLDSLIGKSPIDAAQDEGLRVPLAGAIYVLDAYSQRSRYSVDVDGLRRQLQLPEVPAVEPRANLPLNTISAIQLMRISVDRLDDRQLSVVLNRALLIHHSRYLRLALEEALRRPLPEFDAGRAYMTLADLAREECDTPAALHWIDEGRNAARSGDNVFENVFRWDAKELALRLDDPSDPDVVPFVRKMAGYYGPKIPRYLEYLSVLLDAAGVEGVDIAEPVGTTTAGGLWTPEQPTGNTESKLWLPGM